MSTKITETAAWQKKSGKSPSGGLNAKGRASYEKENPGSDLKAPQPEGGSRKKSFCARMGGMKKSRTSAKTANDPDSRINKALRKWNCSTDINTKGDPAMNERNKKNRDAVRQLTSGQTPAEVKAQKSLETANPEWITSDDEKSPRQQAHDSRRGVKQAREALAEACWKGYKAKGMKKKGSKVVPNCVKEAKTDYKGMSANQVINTPPYERTSGHVEVPYRSVNKKRKNLKPVEKTRNELGVRKAREALAEKIATKAEYEREGEGESYKRLKQVQKSKSPESPKKAPRTRRDTLGRADAAPSSNHPDYLKKKMYNRPTKDGGYGKEGDTTPADTQVNSKGVRGHEAEIAKEKAGNERKAKAQRISNKLRSKRGLVPLLPGEKHGKQDKLGDTEN